MGAYRADPRAVVALGLLLTVGVCLAETGTLLVSLPILILGMVLSRTDLSVWRFVRAILVIAAITLVANGFLIPGERLGPDSLGWFRPSQEGLAIGFRQTLRLTNLILISSWTVHHVDAMDFLASLEWSVRAWPRLKRLVHQVVLPIALAMRMIGTLRDEGERILQVQKLRSHHKIRFRAFKAMLPAWVLSVVHRGDDLATAMQIRGYHPDQGRLYLRHFQFGFPDWSLVLLGVLGFLLLWRVV